MREGICEPVLRSNWGLDLCSQGNLVGAVITEAALIPIPLLRTGWGNEYN